jgi:hypothetical protein
MECTISSESQDQGGSGNVSGTVVHATQPDKKAELVPVDFQTVSKNFGRRREGVKNLVRGKQEPTVSFNFSFAETAILGRCDVHRSTTRPPRLRHDSWELG